MIERQHEALVRNLIDTPGITVLCGPRGAGKSILAARLRYGTRRTLFLDGERDSASLFMDMASADDLQQALGGYHLLIVDEAKRFQGIAPALELARRTCPRLRILAGSSFASAGMDRIAANARVCFTGPLDTTELFDHGGFVAVTDELPQRLVYGNYPGVIQAGTDRESILRGLWEECLLRDVIPSGELRRPEQLTRLLGVLALCLGKQVSYAGIGARVGIDGKTVEKYIDLLERAYLVYRIWSYSKNVSNELRRSFKVCFWDNGIRNSCLDDFRPVDKRLDAEALWENYFITERRKALLHTGRGVRQYFWRSAQKQEISLIELSGRRISAYGLQWVSGKPLRLPLTFRNHYPDARLETASRFNYLNHTLEQQLRLVL